VKGIAIFGANSLSKLLIEFVREDGGEVDNVVVDDEYWTGPSFHGVPLLKYSTVRGTMRFLSAIGYRNMRARRQVFERLVRDGHEPVSFVSLRAMVSRSAALGPGNIIMPGVVIEPLAGVGPGNLFWSQSLVCHEVVVGSHNYVSANCVLGGQSRVGDLCFMGNGSTTIDGVVLADETQILPGSVIFENTAAHTKYFGSPARAIGFHGDAGIVIQR